MVRSNPVLENKPAVLLMDNYLIHMHDDTLKEFIPHHIMVATFPPHTTHLCQCFEIRIFGVFKKRMNFKLLLEKDGSTTVFIG
jgi:hypothetical protein